MTWTGKIKEAEESQRVHAPKTDTPATEDRLAAKVCRGCEYATAVLWPHQPPINCCPKCGTPGQLSNALIVAESTLAAERAEKDREIEGNLKAIPNAIRVREGAGPENLWMSLAISVSKLVRDLAAERASRVQAEIRCENIRFTYTTPEEFRKNRTSTAYSSGYEAGWRDWCGDNPYAYSQQRYFDAYEAGWDAAQRDVREKTARAMAKPSVSPEQAEE